ncbi:MAG: coproporphyrinogen III oxidase family protein, partial [Verrucomicrobiota bacterium]
IALEPEHISTYCLTYEEDTEFLSRFERGELVVDEESDAQLLEFTISRLESAGYEHYEISNYARPGFRSRHNRAYWRGADYLGLGPSAFSTRGHQRWQNVADHHEYARRMEGNISLASNLETLSPEAKLRERIALGLRTGEGIRAELAEPRAAEHLIAAGLLVRSADRVILTRHGKLLADSVAGELI